MRNLYIIIALLVINVSGWSQHTITYTYDRQGRLSEEHYQNFYKASFSYDVEGNLEMRVCEQDYPVSAQADRELSLNDLQVKLYPNPAKGIIHIEMEKDAEETLLQVYSSSGRLILSRTLADSLTSLDLSEQKSGLYFFRFTGNKKDQTIKVLLDSE